MEDALEKHITPSLLFYFTTSPTPPLSPEYQGHVNVALTIH